MVNILYCFLANKILTWQVLYSQKQNNFLLGNKTFILFCLKKHRYRLVGIRNNNEYFNILLVIVKLLSLKRIKPST